MENQINKSNTEWSAYEDSAKYWSKQNEALKSYSFTKLQEHNPAFPDMQALGQVFRTLKQQAESLEKELESNPHPNTCVKHFNTIKAFTYLRRAYGIVLEDGENSESLKIEHLI